MDLKENYKNQVLDTSVNANRTFDIVDQNERTLYSNVQLRETTVFAEQGDDFRAEDVNAFAHAINQLFNVLRPVGSYYYTEDATFNPNDPQSAPGWKGTWERVKDCAIYAAGDTDTAGDIVGSNSHVLTADELPSHRHSIPSLTGTTNSTGAHQHDWYYYKAKSRLYEQVEINGVYTGNDNHLQTTSNGAHTHTVTTDASYTEYTGDATPIDMRPRRVNLYVWRRIS